MTGVGVLLGTAAYMAPEQAKGRAADKRSDIWAFACVLFEMLTARRAFEGEDVTDKQPDRIRDLCRQCVPYRLAAGRWQRASRG